MPKYQVRRKAESYGHAVGILLLDYRGPFIPGDVGNATTYDYPVLYKTVDGLTLDRVLVGDPEYERAVVDAALELQDYGVKGISSDCGFLINYQHAVTKVANVPVFMSSMLQLPFVASSVGSRPVGMITANSASVGNRVLELAGVRTDQQIIVKGLEDEPHFKEAILEEGGTLDSDLIESEIVEAAKGMVEKHPDMGALVIECSLLPPYSKSVQDAIGLPVFDFISMIDYFYAGTHQQHYYGYY
ncbi:MAG: aspartate/glutamate racemase family protein [Gammaproteobacteria bacterium]|nr:aspartate/glutamate racemase family protein [Gammaproteobacteria bacterium]